MNISYAEMVDKLAKPGQKIREEMTDENWSILRHAICDLLYYGDLLDLAKKKVIYQKDDIALALPSGNSRNPYASAEQYHLLHMAIGIAGESVELLEAIFNYIDGSPLDAANVLEELGDIEFYMEGLRQGISITREDTLNANILKLAERYKRFTYSDTAAQQRADKNPA